MPELTLHFEAAPGTDTAAAAAALQKELQAIPAVESAETSAQHFQAIGPSEVLSIIQIGTQVAQNTAAFLSAAAAVCLAWEKLRAHFPGLGKPSVEVGLDQVPVDKLSEEHRQELAAG